MKIVFEDAEPMITERSWKEFREAGLLWYINTVLQPFGWSIMTMCNVDTGEVIDAYPVRTKFRGFSEDVILESCEKLVQYMQDNADELIAETQS